MPPRKPTPLALASLLRVSTAGQVEDGYGLDQQETACREFFTRTEHRHVETLIDDGISGRVRNRPAVKRLLELLANGDIQGVVTPNIDRIGRGAHIIHDILNAVRAAGGVVLYANVELPEGPAGRFLENVLIGHAEYQWEVIRQNTMSGRTEKAQQQRYPGGLQLFGYRLITRAMADVLPQYAGRDGELEVEPREADLVRELFQRCAAGEARSSLAKWLGGQSPGVKGGKWTPSGVRRVLRCRAYVGELTYGAQEWKSISEQRDAQGNLVPYDGKKRVEVHRRPGGGQIIPCPAIVPMEVWEQVQAILDSCAEIDSLCGQRSASYALRGCIQCAYCKRQDGVTPILYHGHRGNTNPTRKGYRDLRYRCTRCFTSLKASRIEARALAHLEAAAQEEAMVRRVRARIEARLQGRGELTAKLARAEEALQQCDAEERKAALLVEAGISPKIIRERVEIVHQKRAQAEATLRDLQELQEQSVDLEQLVQEARQQSALIRAALNEARDDPAKLQALFRRLVRVVGYKRGHTKIHLLLDH